MAYEAAEQALAMVAELLENLPKFSDKDSLNQEELIVFNRIESAQDWADQAEEALKKCLDE